MKQSLKQCRSQWARWEMVRACAVLFVLGSMLSSAQAVFAQQTVSTKPVAPTEVSTEPAAEAPAPVHIAAVTPQAISSLSKPAAAPAAKPVAEEEEETAKPAKAGGEGIKIHGHWKIIVANPDGTVASTTEFENSLVTPGDGDLFLAELLSGQVTWGGMTVIISGNGQCNGTGCRLVPGSSITTTSPYANPPQFVNCGGIGGINYGCYPGLTTSFTESNSSTNPATPAFVTLQGSFIDAGPETFTTVSTQWTGCASTVVANSGNNVTSITSASTISTSSPSACAGSPSALPAGVSTTFNPFTQKTLSPTLSTTMAGQQVTIIVTISFS